MTPDLVEPRIVKYLYRRSAASHIPVSGTFELTPMCNMNCEMCYVRMSKEEVEKSGGRLRTVQEWTEMAETVRRECMLFLLLTGGEPFLYPGFQELYEQLSGMGFVISINTNATMIDEKTVEWLKRYPPGRMNITLYGASDETYGRLCHNLQGYTQVKKALEQLQKAGIMVKLNCSVTPYNVSDLPEMVRFAEERGLMLQASAYMFPPLRRNEHMAGQNNRFTPEEAAFVSAEIVRLQNGDGRFAEYVSRLKDGKAVMAENMEECLVEEGDIVRCGAGRCAFWMTWDGRMLPCGMMPHPAVYPFRDGFADAWKELTGQIEAIRLPGKCSSCSQKEQCHTCAAMVLTETGTFTEVPEYRCRMTKSYLEACQKIRDDLPENIWTDPGSGEKI